MKHISVDAFKAVIASEANNPTVDFINVCTPAEYNEKHIAGVRSVPLNTLPDVVATLRQKRTIYVHCRSGNRSRKAIEQLQALGVTAELVNVEGGLMAWEGAGLTTSSHTSRLPIMRQVFITAGALVLLGTLSGYLVDPKYLIIPTLVSFGLIISGASGWCGMALLLSKMPWNK